ncbi:MAG: hypothetical protein O3B95_00870 [Chloroflexi bacterium]|nr:hypothetical protein [Chloroflexota bacterium]
MKLFGTVLLVSALILLTACQSSSIPDSEQAQEQQNRDEERGTTPIRSTPIASSLKPFRTPQPASAVVVIDGNLSRSGFIGSDGGTIEAMGGDGTGYTLNFPHGVLVDETLITLTPIVSASAWPIVNGEAALGVRILPDATRLMGEAALTIRPGRAVGSVAAFSAESGGGNFHFDLINPGTDAIILPITHFGDQFIGETEEATGDQHEVEGPSAGRVAPEDLAGQLANVAGEILARERARQLKGDAPDEAVFNRLRELGDEFYTHAIEPYIDEWAHDCEASKEHTATAFQWARYMILIGVDEDDVRITKIFTETVRAVENCLNELLEPCLKTSDLPEALGLLRTLNLLSDSPEYEEFDVFESICGGVYGSITSESIRLPLNDIPVGYDGDGPIFYEQTVTGWFSLPSLFDEESDDSAEYEGTGGQSVYLEVRGKSRREHAGLCGISYQQEDWFGSASLQATLLVDFQDANIARISMGWGEPARGLSVSHRFDRDCNVHHEETIAEWQWSLDWQGGLDGKVSPDRKRVTFDFRSEDEFNHSTATLTGVLYSKNPLHRWD